MSVILGIAMFGVFTAEVLTWWFDYQTSGKKEENYWLQDILLRLAIAIFVSSLTWAFSSNFAKVMPYVLFVLLSALSRSLSYAWYRGPLKDVRRRWVEKRRAEWEGELRWLEHQDLILAKETAYAFEDCSPTMGDILSRHNAEVATRNGKKKIKLEWKLKHIIP